MKKITILIGLALISCSVENGIDGVDGRDGVNGIDGSNGIDGKSIGLITESDENGCNSLTFYYDANNNQIKEPSEAEISSLVFCNGTDGTDSPNILMFSSDADENICAYGGKIFSFYQDLNSNGEYDIEDIIIGTESICNGETGGVGQNGSDADIYNIFIEEATTDQCSNGGFVANVFLDSNNNGVYDIDNDTITSENIICFPDRNTLPMPDYSALGHTMQAIGIWRLYSIKGVPVDESDRFNIYIYPDDLNPNLLVDVGANQSGWLDFKDSTKIGFTYSDYSNETGFVRGVINFDESKVEGLKQDRTYADGSGALLYIPETDGDPEYVYFSYPSNYDNTWYDTDIWSQELEQCIFYRVNE